MKRSRCAFLVPVAYNDGREIESEVLIALKNTLQQHGFGAFTVRGPFEGTWEGQVELVMEYTVAIPRQRVAKLKSLVKEFLKGLGQQAMYFDAPAPSVEIISLEDKSPRIRK